MFYHHATPGLSQPGYLCLLLLWQDLPVIVPTVDRHGGTGGLPAPSAATGAAHHDRKTMTRGWGCHADSGNITSGTVHDLAASVAP